MFLPVSDGFAPNVNVNIQPYPGSIKDYIGLSKGQFQKMKWNIVEEKQTGDTEWAVSIGPGAGHRHAFLRPRRRQRWEGVSDYCNRKGISVEFSWRNPSQVL